MTAEIWPSALPLQQQTGAGAYGTRLPLRPCGDAAIYEVKAWSGETGYLCVICMAGTELRSDVMSMRELSSDERTALVAFRTVYLDSLGDGDAFPY